MLLMSPKMVNEKQQNDRSLIECLNQRQLHVASLALLLVFTQSLDQQMHHVANIPINLSSTHQQYGVEDGHAYWQWDHISARPL